MAYTEIIYESKINFQEKRIEIENAIESINLKDNPKTIELINRLFSEIENPKYLNRSNFSGLRIATAGFLAEGEKVIEELQTLLKNNNELLGSLIDLYVDHSLKLITSYINASYKTSTGELKSFHTMVSLRKASEEIRVLMKFKPSLNFFEEFVTIQEKIEKNYEALSPEAKTATTNYENRKNGSSSGCYIATQVYGSFDAPEVKILRLYRDTVLINNVIGKKLIQIYYLIAPYLVSIAKKNSRINHIFKILLDKFICTIKNSNF